MKDILTQGAHSPLTELSEEERLQDLQEAITYGNHKSASTEKERVTKELEADVIQGWQLPITLDNITNIPEVIVAPLGMVPQATMNEDGSKGMKWRMTHDQTFPFSSTKSVNKRMIFEDLQECMFGFALRRFLYTLVAYRMRYSQTSFLMSKTDYKSAYRRIHQDGLSAMRSMITTVKLDEKDKEIGIICLRATFGNAANPSLFSVISESGTDLVNQLLNIIRKTNLPASQYDKMIKEPIRFGKSRPFGQARQMIIEPRVSEDGIFDNYINDCFGGIPDLPHLDPKRGIKCQVLSLDAQKRIAVSKQNDSRRHANRRTYYSGLDN
jgi:hypothetical protein